MLMHGARAELLSAEQVRKEYPFLNFSGIKGGLAGRPSGAVHFYCSVSDKGGLVFGGDLDG